jgi:hypothetical protein
VFSEHFALGLAAIGEIQTKLKNVKIEKQHESWLKIVLFANFARFMNT